MPHPKRRADRTTERPHRYDFHSHTYYTDGSDSPAAMWQAADLLGHRVLAITDHIGLDDPKPLLDRLHASAKAWEGGPLQTYVGVELTLVPPRRIADTARNARQQGAQIVLVHGETPAEPVPPGTNHAAIGSGEVDVLAHPGLITRSDAELARDHGVLLELSGHLGHSLTNGHVARVALAARARLVVDSDAHRTRELIPFERARTIAMGAGLAEKEVQRALRDAPLELIKRLASR
jgi:putative hydrolase